MRKISNTVLLILFAVILTSCTENKPKQKPFTVIEKQFCAVKGGQLLYYYTLQDGNNQVWIIEEEGSVYKVGDTIK